MRTANPPLRRLARRLLALEAQAGETGERGDAAFRVNEKLRQPLSLLTGAAGFRSLLSRALALGSGEVRWLKAVHVGADGSLEGIDDIGAQLSPDEIADGEAVLIAQLIGLLVTFIGEGLTAHLLQDVWPEVSARDLNVETENDDG